MENEKDIKAVDKETREFLEHLEPAELRRLLDTPVFSGTVLQHATQSERLSQAVDDALDAEFREMSPEQQKRINRLAARLAQKHAPAAAPGPEKEGWLTRQWRLVAAGARRFGGAEPALVMAAHEKTEPGWPFELEMGAARLCFDVFGFDLVLSNNSAPGGPTVLVDMKSGRSLLLAPGQKESLGDIEEFQLADTSDKDQITSALERQLEVRTQP